MPAKSNLAAVTHHTQVIWFAIDVVSSAMTQPKCVSQFVHKGACDKMVPFLEKRTVQSCCIHYRGFFPHRGTERDNEVVSGQLTNAAAVIEDATDRLALIESGFIVAHLTVSKEAVSVSQTLC